MTEQLSSEDREYYDSRNFAAFQQIQEYSTPIEDANSSILELGDTVLESTPLANFAVLIPVAAHQEAHSIYKTLSLYSRQKTEDSFSVVLSMNYPTNADLRAVGDSFDELSRAQQDFPDLDIRHFETQYLDPTIGGIRADLWDATLLAGKKGGTITPQKDMVCCNHDIDLEKMPRSYIATLQQHFKNQDTVSRQILHNYGALENNEAPILLPVFGNMKHANDSAYPNISKATFWSDNIVKTRSSGFEAGIVMSMGYYAGSGGFSADDAQCETLNILARGGASNLTDLVRAPAAETSVRRYVEKLNRPESGLDQIWEKNSFSATESYRKNQQNLADISTERLHEMIEKDIGSLEASISINAIGRLGLECTKDYELKRIARKISKSDKLSRDEHEVITSAFDTYLESPTILAQFVLERVVKYPNSESVVNRVRNSASLNFTFETT